MAESPVAPEYERLLARRRREGTAPEVPHALDSGTTTGPLQVNPDEASKLLVPAALRAAGIYRSSSRSTIVWVEGARELAVVVAEMRLELTDGFVVVVIPVRCDQVGTDVVRVTFAVGAPGRPAGLYAATQQRPAGHPLVVDAWSEALVAFAWQCLLGLIAGLAGAVGKDARGNVLVPVSLEASANGLTILPMARHRFAGSSGLSPTVRTT